MENRQRPIAISRSTALKVALFYTLLSGMWIVISDGLVYLHGGEASQPAMLNATKGLVFVFMTATALYLFMTRWVRESQRERELINSEQKETERQIHRLKDVYAALSQTNQCIVRCSSRDELFQTICEIAVKFGHFRMAWIGLVDEAKQTIVPIEWAGEGFGYLNGLRISTDPTSPFNSGPVGQAATTGLSRIANDVSTSSEATPCYARASEFGLKSLAAFPLFTKDRVIGTLNLCSGDVGFFTQDLIALLDEMALDITHALDRFESEADLAFFSHYDPITSLPNRLLGKDRMERAMVNADRKRCKAALLDFDIDHFKRVNESLGHSVGDALLKAVVERLRGCIRETDTFSRVAGNEFMIALSDIHDPEAINRVVAHILEKMIPSFRIDGLELSVSVSVGIAVYPDDGSDFDMLLRRAETAMSHAKDAGRNTYRFFAEQMNTDANEYLRVLNDLRKGLERGEFTLHYQPQISLADNRVVGAEALIRWNHPDLGFLPPGRFIPIAEDSGLIVEIGAWVLREACRQAVIWREAGHCDVIVAVNLSAVQFQRDDLLESVGQALAQSGLHPSGLELELTESILIKNTKNVLSTVKRLKALGVKLSIDDFGTGYSSLAYLKRFDLDKLKIDQSFVRDIATDPDNDMIVKAIVQLARGLGIKTIAEGVEDVQNLNVIRQHGCDEVQGYHFAKPMPPEQFKAFVADFHAGPSVRLRTG